MDSRRQLRIASLIKEAFTEVLLKEGQAIYGKTFVTLSQVTVTSDLTLARFYLSIYHADNADEIIHRFDEHKAELKHHLAEKLRHHIRRIPEIAFFKDETMDYVFHIEDVFEKIKKEDETLKTELAGKRASKASGKTGEKKPKITKR